MTPWNTAKTTNLTVRDVGARIEWMDSVMDFSYVWMGLLGWVMLSVPVSFGVGWLIRVGAHPVLQKAAAPIPVTRPVNRAA